MTIPQDFGYFPTPPAVVARLLELARLRPGMRVLEPSAGRGNIVQAVEAKGCSVYAVELLPDNVKALEAQDLAYQVDRGDFLEKQPQGFAFDRVVMNPPFAKQADIHHVNHALKFLKPSGVLVSVMSSSVTFRDNSLSTVFRNTIRQRGGDIEAVPEGSFKQSGTMVNTVIVTIPA